MTKNKKLIVGGIAILSMTAIIVGQTNAASNTLKNGTRNNTKIEHMNKGIKMGSGSHTGLHLGSGNRPEFESGDKKHLGSGFKLGSGEKEHMGSGFKFGSGEKKHLGSGEKNKFGSGNKTRSGEKKDYIRTGTTINSGTKAKITKAKITTKTHKTTTKKASPKKK